jgi:hypothetical protein
VTDVFLSYSSKDRGGTDDDGTVRRDRVSPVVKLLEEQGFKVFWDAKVPQGVSWDDWIRQKLSEAKCAVVLWSANSVKSPNVRHEANIANDEEKIISVMIDPLKSVQFPMGLYDKQAVVLLDWDGDEGDANWQMIVGAVEAKLAPHAPLWFQRMLHAHEADLGAERERVKIAQSRAKQIEKTIAKSAQSVLTAERDRDAAVEEAATLKARLEEEANTHSAMEARLAQVQENLRTSKTAQQELAAKLKEAEAAIEPTKQELETLKRQHNEAKGELETANQNLVTKLREHDELGEKLRKAERELDELKRELTIRKPKPTIRGGAFYAVLAGVIALISVFSLSEILGSAPAIAGFGSLLALGLPVETGIVGALGAFALSSILLLVRRRQVGALELAFYWSALSAPIAMICGAAIGSWLRTTYLWQDAQAYFVGFLAGWLLLVASAWICSARRGPGLSGPAIAAYWLGICLPWLLLPVANFAYFGVFGLSPFYIRPVSGEDYSGYVIALLLVAASGIFIARRWPRRSPGMVHPQQASSGSLAVGVFWLLGMIVITLALMALFTTNVWDWVGAATYAPEIGAFATGALVAMLIVLGSAAMLGNKRAPLDDGEARLYWLGSAASVILFLGSFFAAKEVNWVGAASSFVGGAWSGAIFALAGWAIFFAIRRYREG